MVIVVIALVTAVAAVVMRFVDVVAEVNLVSG